DLALVVHHVVVFQELLADIVVARLDLLLRLGQRLVDPGMDDRLTLLEAEPLQRSEEHTSELQSRSDLVCRLLLEKKKKKKQNQEAGTRQRSIAVSLATEMEIVAP